MADFQGSPGPDFLEGTAGNDTFEFFLGGEDFIRGLEGFDTLDARAFFGDLETVGFALTGE